MKARHLITVVVLATMLLVANVQPASAVFTAFQINRYAGNGTTGSSGNGGAATSALVNGPLQNAIDSSGTLYFADYNNHVVRKITSGGIISIFAGTGSSGYSGDGGAATSAQLAGPKGAALDSAGNLYIGDYDGNIVRKVTPGGIISTFAGTGVGGYTGDSGAATSAKLNSPNQIAVDSSGNVFISDYGNHVIRKVSTGGIITTAVGTGVAGYSGDSGAATAAKIDGPKALLFDSAGNLYISDYTQSVVRKVTPGGTISSFAGTGTPGNNGDGGAASVARVSAPIGLVTDASGNIYIGDCGAGVVRRVDTGGTISTVAGNGTQANSGDGGSALSAQMGCPAGLAIDSSGNLIIDDFDNAIIRIVSLVAPASGSLQASAYIDPAFTFTVTGRSSVCNGQSSTNFQTGSTPTAISLGHLSSATVGGGAQDLGVVTNAANGFSVYIKTTGTTPDSFRDSSSHSVSDVSGTNASPGSAPVAGTAGFGYTTSDASTAFTSNKWAKVTGTNATVLVATAGTTSKSACVGYEIAVAAGNYAGSYSSPIVYTGVPSF